VSLYSTVGAVRDPELRVVSIAELGILRDVAADPDGHVRVVITPTYSGCPAMDLIKSDIRAALTDAGHSDVEIVTRLSPAWSTDLISESGRRALAEAGIAPPSPAAATSPVLRIGRRPQTDPACPRCGSGTVSEISRYGSTACQSLWRCERCREPFNAVKPL
jgi:ring-1,2-phenylacetyl-CoA epoxidase subunit PaaD